MTVSRKTIFHLKFLFAAIFTIALHLQTPSLAQDKTAAADPLPENLDQLENRIADIVDASNLIGIQFAFANDKGVYWQASFGHEDSARSTPLSDDALFRSGSITKSFTGVVAQILAQQGVFSLNDALRDIAPDIAFENKWADTAPITLAHLAEHTAGWDDAHFGELKDWGKDVSNEKGVSAYSKSRRARWQPGRYMSYSNAGPAVLGAVMEQQTGQSYEDLLRTHLFKPLGMAQSTTLLSSENAPKPVRSFGPANHPTPQAVPFAHIGMPASGALSTNAQELGNFAAMLLARGRFNGEVLLAPEDVARVETATTTLGAQAGLDLAYGLGVSDMPQDKYRFKGHAGAVDSFYSEYAYSTDLNQAFVMMTNYQDWDAITKIKELIIAYLAKDATQPVTPTPQPIADTQMVAGIYKNVTPRYEFARLLSLPDFLIVSAQGDTLTARRLLGPPMQMKHFGENLYSTNSAIGRDWALVGTDDTTLELVNNYNSTYRKLSPALVFGPIAIVVLFALSVIGLAIAAILFAIGRPFGAFKNAKVISVWSPFYLATFSILGAAFMFAQSISTPPNVLIAELGAPSTTSIGILVLTIAFAVLSAVGLVHSFRSSAPSGAVSLPALITAVVFLAMTGLLWRYGWIGLTTWGYTPSLLD